MAQPQTDFGDVQEGKLIYLEGISNKGVTACSSCHGNVGDVIDEATPWLRGMTANYVYQQMDNYKNSNRSNDRDGLMREIARELSDEELKDLAAYISTL